MILVLFAVVVFISDFSEKLTHEPLQKDCNRPQQGIFCHVLSCILTLMDEPQMTG